MRDDRDYVTEEDATKMFKAASDDKERLLLKTLWYSGRRISEVVGERGITLADITEEPGLIRFTILKKREQVTKLKPMDESLIKELVQFCTEQNKGKGDKVFPENRFWAFRVFRKVAQKAGIKEAGGRIPHPHSFRHSFAIRAVKVSNTPTELRALQDILEHKDFKTTEAYLQHNPIDAKNLMDKMNKHD